MMKNKVVFVSSDGGHMDELTQLKEVIDRYHVIWVNTSKYNNKNKHHYYIVDISRENKLLCLYYLIVNFIQSLMIIYKIRPKVVISTGALAAVPFCLLSKLFCKRLIYVESFARITSASATGKLLYYVADVFIIQWESLRDFYPKAIYGGWIY